MKRKLDHKNDLRLEILNIKEAYSTKSTTPQELTYRKTNESQEEYIKDLERSLEKDTFIYKISLDNETIDRTNQLQSIFRSDITLWETALNFLYTKREGLFLGEDDLYDKELIRKLKDYWSNILEDYKKEWDSLEKSNENSEEVFLSLSDLTNLVEVNQTSVRFNDKDKISSFLSLSVYMGVKILHEILYQGLETPDPLS